MPTSAEAPREAAKPPSKTEDLAGHDRMLDALQLMATQLKRDALYFGVAQRDQLKDRLSQLPEDAPVSSRVDLMNQLSVEEMVHGDVETALALLLDAERAWENQDQRETASPGLETYQANHAYRVGVAFMRLGEVENCLAMHNVERCLLPIQGEGVHTRREGSTKAVPYLTRALESRGANLKLRLKARWLLNIAYMTLGKYPEDVPKQHLIPPSSFRSDETFPRFVDIAPRLGLDQMSLAGGIVAEDFDGDGFLDLMVSSFAPFGQLRYYRNDGDGGFVDETEQAGLLGLIGGLNLKHADYDNDGDVDVYVMRGGWMVKRGRQPNSLLRRNDDGTFTDVTFAAGLARANYPTQTAGWADYDNDGDLDLYVGNENGKNQRSPSQLFRNEGDGTFTDVAAIAGVQNFEYTKGVTWGDYDGDRLQDLYVSNFRGANRLYHNLGNGTFVDVAQEAGVINPHNSFSAWFWDYDNDGSLDLYVSAYKGDTSDIAGSYLGMAPQVPVASLYKGDGKGHFRDVARRQNLTKVTMPMGSNYGDLDNDGFLDFYLSTGYPEFDGLMPNLMYRNRGGMGFSDVTSSGGFGHLQKGHAISFADFDNDGDQDVFAEMGGAFPGDAFMNALFENPGFGNHWLKVKLVGTDSNRSAIGARLRVVLTENGLQRTIFKHVNTGSSFGSNPLRQEIGLGSAEKIDTLEVFWPTTGKTQVFEDLQVDQAISIREDASTVQPLPIVAIDFSDSPSQRHQHPGGD